MTIGRQVVFWIATLLAFVIFLLVFGKVLLPFVAGMILAYALDPLAGWFERRGLGRGAATLVILILFILVVVLVYFAVAFTRRDLTMQDKRQLGATAVFFVFSAVCWSALEQAGSTLNLFAQRNTDLSVLSFDMPASWLQSVTPILIISLSPVFAWLWVALARRGLEPTSLRKFVAGMSSIGLGFGLMVLASLRAAGGHPRTGRRVEPADQADEEDRQQGEEVRQRHLGRA